MSATINEDAAKSVSNQEGQVGSHVARDQPQTTHGHKPGILTGNEKIPESHAQTLPAGSAPADRTFRPNTGAYSVPGQALNPDADPEGTTSAADTFPGATSKDVHTGLGHPGSGMTSQEAHHDMKGGRKKMGQGLQGVGAEEAGSFDMQGSTGKRVSDV